MRRPSLSGLGRVPRSIAYAFQDFLFMVGRVPKAIASGLREFWDVLSVRTRQHLTLAVLGAVAVIVLLAFAVPALPCQFPGGDACPPPDDAEKVVPADALAYVHLNLDPESDQYKAAAGAAAELPGVAQQVIGRVLAQLPGPNGRPADFARDVAPWFGGQAAVAIVPRGSGAEQVQLLEEGDADAAARFGESIVAGSPQATDYQGVELTTDERGLATASVGDFLVIGTETGVRRIIDVAEGAEGERALSDDTVAEEVRDELPPERFLDAYVSEDGMEQLIASEVGPLSSLEPFVDATASRGAAASIGAQEDAFELAVRSALDPDRSKASPGFFAAFPTFEPSLPEDLAGGSLGYVGIADPAKTVSELVAQATAEAPALAEGFASAVRQIRDLGRVDVEEQLLPSLGGEAAFALQPGVEGTDPAPGEQTTTAPPAAPEGLPGGPAPTTNEPPVPILQFLADGVDGERATDALARLQGPISEAFDPSATLQAPVFDRREVDGVDVQVLRISPTVNMSYAVVDDQLVVATQPEGVEEVIGDAGGLNDADGFERATEDFPDDVSLLAYLDLGGLIRLGEREGLAEDPAYTAFAEEIRRLDAFGLAVKAESDAIATDVRLTLEPGDPDDPANADPPVD